MDGGFVAWLSARSGSLPMTFSGSATMSPCFPCSMSISNLHYSSESSCAHCNRTISKSREICIFKKNLRGFRHSAAITGSTSRRKRLNLKESMVKLSPGDFQWWSRNVGFQLCATSQLVEICSLFLCIDCIFRRHNGVAICQWLSTILKIIGFNT